MSSVPKISYAGRMHKSYPSGERHRKRPILEEISSMTNDEIIRASVRNAEEKVKQSNAARVLTKGPLMFLAATTVVYGALKKGKLSDKVLETVKTAGVAGTIIAMSKPVDRITSSIFESDEENKHTALHALVNMAALAGVSLLALKGMTKGAKKLAKVFEPSAKSLKKVLSSGAEWLNSTKAADFTNKISKHAANFSTNHPRLSGVLKASAIFAPLASSLGVSYAASKKLNEQRQGITASNINKLVLCREFARAGVEKQNQEQI